MKIKEINKESRPRERLIKEGVDKLSDAEILAILINSGTMKYSALELAHILLNKYTLNELLYLSYEELAKTVGIKEAKGTKIIAAFELAKRAIKVNEKEVFLDNPDSIYEYLKSFYLYLKTEKVLVLIFNSQLRLLKTFDLANGDLANVGIDMKKLVSALIKYDAYGFVLAHNHPSGNVLPSKNDKELTVEIANITKEINIILLDHIIWGKEKYFSFLSNKLLNF